MSTILLLDNDAEFRQLVVPGLIARGHVVAEATTGDEAAGRSDGVELFIVGGELPDGDGVTWITNLRRRDETAKIIYVSRQWHDEQSFANRLLSNDLKVSLVLHKPVIPMDFLEQVDRVLMMSSKVPGTRASRLTEGFAKRLPEKLEQIESSIRTITSSGEGVSAAVETLIVLSHKLRGTAASFGFPGVGLAAGEIEEITRVIRDGGDFAGASAGLSDALMRAKSAASVPFAEELKGDSTEPSSKPGKNLFVSSAHGSFANLAKMNVLVSEPADAVRAASQFDVLSLLVDLRSIPGDTAFDIVKQIRSDQPTSPAIVGVVADISVTPASALYIGASMIAYSSIESQFSYLPSSDDLTAWMNQLNDLSYDSKPKILLIDDDVEFCFLIESTLQYEGITVASVSNVEEVLNRIEILKPTMLLLDVALSDSATGFDICRAIRDDKNWHHLPIVFLTANAELETRVTALQAGADEFLTKPLVKEHLLERIKRTVQKEREIQNRWQNDTLTGLKLRSTFLEQARDLISARTALSDVSLLLIQIQWPEAFETESELDADSNSALALRSSIVADLSSMIRYRFRIEDLRGRWSENQFAILLPGIEGDTASRCAEMLVAEFRSSLESRLQTLDAAICPLEDNSVALKIAVASFPVDGKSIDDLLAAADARLY